MTWVQLLSTSASADFRILTSLTRPLVVTQIRNRPQTTIPPRLSCGGRVGRYRGSLRSVSRCPLPMVGGSMIASASVGLGGGGGGGAAVSTPPATPPSTPPVVPPCSPDAVASSASSCLGVSAGWVTGWTTCSRRGRTTSTTLGLGGAALAGGGAGGGGGGGCSAIRVTGIPLGDSSSTYQNERTSRTATMAPWKARETAWIRPRRVRPRPRSCPWLRNCSNAIGPLRPLPVHRQGPFRLEAREFASPDGSFRRVRARRCLTLRLALAALHGGGVRAGLARVPVLGLLDGVRLEEIGVLLGHLRQPAVVEVQGGELGLAQLLDGDQAVAGAIDGGDNLVELELDGQGVLVLRALDEERHQEGDDGGPRVDAQLPRVGVVEQRPGGQPADDDQEGHGERPGAAGPV